MTQNLVVAGMGAGQTLVSQGAGGLPYVYPPYPSHVSKTLHIMETQHHLEHVFEAGVCIPGLDVVRSPMTDAVTRMASSQVMPWASIVKRLERRT